MIDPEQEEKLNDLQREIEELEHKLKFNKEEQSAIRPYVEKNKKLKLYLKEIKKELKQKLTAMNIINNFIGSPLKEKQEELFNENIKEDT